MNEITLDSPTARALAALMGSAAHVLLFRRGEWHRYTVTFILSFASVEAAAIALLPKLDGPLGTNGSYTAAAKIAATLGALWTAGVFGSMAIYRGFFHRLCRFPGPFLARFSNFYVTALEAKNMHLYEEVQALHKQYGDIVRLGPSELSVANAEIFQAIAAPNSTCTKGPWYDILYPVISLQGERTRPEHSIRRKVWDRGFSAKALRDYEPRVHKYADQLIAKIDESKGNPIDATLWFNFFSFDVMGDLAWGKSFNMLRDGIKHYFMTALHADMVSVGLFSHLVWLFPAVKATPIVNRGFNKFWEWIDSQVKDRSAMKPERPDVFTYLLDDYESKPRTKQEEINLAGDAYLIAVAGSDTTAASLTCLFYLFSKHPEVLKTLQKELDAAYEDVVEHNGAGAKPDYLALGKLPYLNAVINESIRLHPPVPGGLQRQTPSAGLRVGDIYIPGDTIIQAPTHTLHRDERYWVKPNDFIPERWTDKPELIIDGSVYGPFGYGRSSCIGKQLGLMEIRYVTAELARRFDVKFAPGQTEKAFLDGKKDTFTLSLSKLDLVFSSRA